MSQDSKERVYEPAEIEARLERELPHWRYENGWIRRTFRTSSWKGTLMVINAVGHLAEAAWHHPDIAASYAWVEVKLQNHSAKGITDKDFELARKIEDFVSWRPGQGGRRARRDAGRRPALRLHQIRRQVSRQMPPSGLGHGIRWRIRPAPERLARRSAHSFGLSSMVRLVPRAPVSSDAWEDRSVPRVETNTL